MSESESLSPRDQAERVALFRAELIGAVSRRALSRGELAAALRALAAERYLPPGSKTLRRFGVSTFERWLYAYRAHRASVRQLVVSRPGHAQTRVRTTVVGCPASAHSASARQMAARP